MLVGLTGVGGGALMTPVLLVFFGVHPLTAIATDLWYSVFTKSVAAGIHHRSGQVDWQVVKRLWWGSLPSALAVVLAIHLGMQRSTMDGLSKVVGALVMVTALGLFLAPRLSLQARHRRLDNPEKFKAAQPLLTLMAGALLGVCVALTSVGAGALGGVLLLYLYPLRMTPNRLVATDLMHAIPLAVVAGLGYLSAGMVDGALLLHLLEGSIPGAVAGSLLAGKLEGRWLKRVLAVVLLLAGFRTLMK